MSEPAGRRGPVATIVVEGFFSRLSFGIISFALPLMAHDLGMGLGQIGLLLGFNTVVSMILKVPMAWLSDSISHRSVLIIAIILRSLVALLLVLAASPWQLFAIRGVHGVSMAMRGPASNALIAANGGKETMATTFAWYQTVKSLAGSFGKGLAGIALGLSAARFPGVFALAFAMSILPIWVVVRYLHEPPSALRPEIRSRGVTGESEREPMPSDASSTSDPSSAAPVAAVAVLGLLVTTTAYMMAGLFPVLAVEYAGLSTSQTGLILLLAGGVTLVGPIFGRLSDNVSRRLVLSLRSGANIGSSALYLLAPTMAGFTAARLCDDAGKAAFKPAWGALMAQISSLDPRRRARVMSKASLGEDAGQIAGPLVAGLLWSTWGVAALFGVRIVMAIGTELYATVLARRLRAGANDPRAPTGANAVYQAEPPGRRILLIEADPRVSSLVTDSLQPRRWEVVVADDDTVGRFLASTEDFDAIVLDLASVDADGYALLAELRQADRDCPLLALTGDDDVDTNRRCHQAGATTVLTRPLRLPQLRTELARLVDRDRDD